MKISQLKPNESNPRLIKGEKFKKLVQSIKDFPQMLELRPIVIDEDNVILGGNMRYRACVEAGLKDVPVKIAKGLTEEQKQEFIVKDNVGFGEWDWALLGNEWNTKLLDDWGLDIWQNEDDLEEPKFDELTNDTKKDAVIKITFKNENQLENAEEEIAKIVDKYEKAFYSVSFEK